MQESPHDSGDLTGLESRVESRVTNCCAIVIKDENDIFDCFLCLLRHFFRPKPRVEFARNSINYITSSMDSSDGLSTCLNELANQSKKRFFITDLPTNDDIREFSKRNKIDLRKLVLDGGEEFELVFTICPKNVKKIHKLAKKFKISIHEIGIVKSGKGVLFENTKESFMIKDKGWDHFR